jgi:hypothetical protein
VNEAQSLDAIQKGVAEAFWAFIDLSRDISTLDAVENGTESAMFRFLTQNRDAIIDAIAEGAHGLIRDQIQEGDR